MKELLTEWRKYTTKALNEQVPPAAQQEPAAAGAEGAAKPAINLTNQTSFKVFDGNPQLAAQVMTSLLQGGEFFKQLQAAQGGEWFQIKSPEVLKKWVDSIGGVEAFAKRAAAIGGKIPEQGLPKALMPFLPLPNDPKSVAKDPKDVEDALNPGGKYNVDIVEKVEAPKANTFVGLKAPGAADYMKSGFKDGDPNDDTIEVKIGGQFAASKAIPTQTNILFPKGLGMAVMGSPRIEGGPLGAYASTKGEILDGHHRWAATMLNKPDAMIGTTAMIDLTKAGMVPTLKHLTAIGNALGNKTKTK
jgi:hypothetical protein